MKQFMNSSLIMEAALAMTLVGCHVTHPDLPASGPVVAAAPVTLAALVTDADTGLPVASTLTIYTQIGTTPLAGPLESATGVFTYVPTNVTPPATYRLVASADGYTTASQNVTITSAQIKADGSGLATATLPLTNTTSSPTAPVGQATGTAGSDGTTTAQIEATTPATSGIVGTASVTIPADTVITTASGAPLTGAVTLTASYSNAQTTASLAAYPCPNQAIVNGVATTLISWGAVTVTATDANGDVAKNFSPAVDVTIPIPEGTFNLTTNAAVQAGDTVPIYYFSSDGLQLPLTDSNGNPVLATLGAEVGSGATGYFPADFSTTHFCALNAGQTPPTQTLTLTVGGTAGNAIYGDVHLSAGGWYYGYYLPPGTSDFSTITISNLPTTSPWEASIYVGGTTQVYPLTNATTQSIDVSAQVGGVSLAPATFTVQAQQILTGASGGTTLGTLSPLPSALVVATAPGDYAVQGNTDNSGQVTLTGLVQGTTYTITAYYGMLTPQVGTLKVGASGNTLPAFVFQFPAGYTGAGN